MPESRRLVVFEKVIQKFVTQKIINIIYYVCIHYLKIPETKLFLTNVLFRYNGQALIDEDLLRSIGVTDFSKYRCDTAHEPERMMPRKFPSLLVEEENEVVFPKL